ncbi:MAG: DUF5615 family PIN-like protein [Chloroflexota bacterium]
MAKLYTNENFPLAVVVALRTLQHDVVTSFESGKANQAIPDADVLAFATEQSRVLVTLNRKHFIGLHIKNSAHAGIVVCTTDADSAALAARIDAELAAQPDMTGQLVRVNRVGCAKYVHARKSDRNGVSKAIAQPRLNRYNKEHG